jgi:hypothetical protein
MAAAQGTYAQSGQASGLRVSRGIVAGSGAYTLSGQVAGTAVGTKIAAAQGSYSLTGQAATLTYTPVSSVGFFSLFLPIGMGLPPVGYVLTAESGTYTITGSDAQVDFAITAASGSYVLTGQAATLTYGAGARTLTAAQGTYSLTGQDARVAVSSRLGAANGTYTGTGTSVGVAVGRILPSAQGTYALTGQSAALKVGRVSTASQGSYILSGTSATLTYSGGTPILDARALRTVYLVSSSGRTKWVDYIPIKLIVPSIEQVNRFDDTGALGCIVLTSPIGQEWVDYIPCVVVADTLKWRFDTTGYIPMVEVTG